MIVCDDKVMFSSSKKAESSNLDAFCSIIATTSILNKDNRTTIDIRKKFKLKIN